MDKKRILVVEDEAVIAIDLKTCLSKLGYEVPAVVSSGEDAVRMVTEMRPDLILMDIKLKGPMDGIEAANEIWKSSPVPIVFVTAHTDSEVIGRAIKVQPYGYLTKPVNIKNLAIAIDMAIYKGAADAQVRKSEEALLKERKVLDGIMKATDVMLVYFDTAFNFVAVNPAYAETCRMRPEDMIGRNHFELYPDEENEAIFRKVRDTGNPVFYRDKPFEFPDQPERGTTYWDWSLSPVKAADGKVVGLVFSLRETTKYKKTEEKLGESEYKFRSLVDNIGIGVSLISPKMEILTLNKKMLEWFPSIDVGTRPVCYRAFNDPPRPEICSYCPTVVTLQDGMVHESTTETPAGDKVIYFRIISSPIKDNNGKVIAAIEMVEDITERKQAEKELEIHREHLEKLVAERTISLWESERKYRKLFEDSMDAVFISTPDGKLLDFNHSAMNMLGYTSRDEMLGLDIAEDVYYDPAQRTIYQQELERSGFVKDYELVVRRKDGKKIFVLSTAVIDRNKEGKIIAYRSIIRDITEKRYLKKALSETSSRERMLVGSELHDSISQILTGASFMCKAVQRRLSGNDNEASDSLNEIGESLNKAIGKIKDISRGLSLYDIESAGLTYSVRELAKNTEKQFGIKCCVEAQDDFISFDKETLRQMYYITQEAVINAAKHSGSKNISIKLQRAGKDSVLIVEDDGTGLPSDLTFNKGMGIKIMKYRASTIGAVLEINSTEGASTSVVCSFKGDAL